MRDFITNWRAGARFIRVVSRRGLAVKITLSILSFNIYQNNGGLMETRVKMLIRTLSSYNDKNF
jgi:hypothetical protein